jgi:hypothetical protein
LGLSNAAFLVFLSVFMCFEVANSGIFERQKPEKGPKKARKKHLKNNIISLYFGRIFLIVSQVENINL